MPPRPSPSTLLGLRLAGWIAATSAAVPPLVSLDLSSGVRFGGVAALVVFLGAFLVATSPRRAVTAFRALLAVETLAAFALAALIPSSATFVLTVVVAAQLPFALPAAPAFVWIAAQAAAAAFLWRHAPAWSVVAMTGTFAGFMLFAYFVGALVEREARARRDLAAAYVALTAERTLAADHIRHAERDRIAADLHDAIGHDLVALRVNLEAALRHEGATSRDHLQTGAELAGRVLADLRQLVSATREDAAVPLVEALRGIAASVPRPRIEVDVSGDLARADRPAAEAALRCVQEAVTNAIRHAGAEAVRVSVREEGGRLVLEVRDDGHGRAEARAGGSGLVGLRERVTRLGGTFVAENAPGGGFLVRGELPLPGGSA